MSINNISASARDAGNVIFGKNRAYIDRVTLATYAWKGDIGSSYKNFNRQTGSKMSIVLNKYRDLSLKLDRLEDSVNKAKNAEVLRAR